MDIAAVIQYILTSAQSFGSPDYYNKSLMTILGLAGVLLCENEQTDTNGLSLFHRKYLVGCLGKLGEVSNQQQIRVTTLRLLSPHAVSFYFLFFVSFSLVFPGRLCWETASAHFGHCGRSLAEL